MGEELTRHYSDSHVHLLNFLQGGEFLNDDDTFAGSRWGEVRHQRFVTLPAGERWRRVAGVMRCMERSNIDRAIVFGMPVVKKWDENDSYERPDGYLDNESPVLLARDTDLIVASAIEEARLRYKDEEDQLKRLNSIAPFVCGIDPTDLGAVDQVVHRILEYPGIWQGVGEIFSRHDDLTHLQLGEHPRANHPALLRVCKFAGENHLPVSIHHNIAPVSRPGSNRPPLYLDELIELFRYCHEEPGAGRESTVFIWCHAGVSRRVRVDDLPYWIDEVLAVYRDHVYVDLSWVAWDDYIEDDIAAWAKLIEKYPDRFMLGSDVVGGATNAAEQLQRFEPLLAALDKKVAQQVAHDNLCDLLDRMAERRRLANLSHKHLAGIELPTDYRFPEYAHMPRLRDEESFVRSRLKERGE
jgi:hypothetical protein